MEKINFPQVISHSDLINPLDPGRSRASIGKLLDELEKEYDKRL
ncbi:MAG: hypothetical protein P4N41_05075 [Negativicutes bacterium]|nr:hypothetical protein [Negativicutes bacterium]